MPYTVRILLVFRGNWNSVPEVPRKFLPGDPLLAKLSRFLTLERGLAIGCALMLLGIVLSVRAVAHWESVHFRNLYPPQMLRQVIPAVVSVTLGLQTVLSSFFLSVLSLKFQRW